ncbi:uncharacterized protein LOC133887158 [Phragmites australis]|uniref:uncharacterized protein LOC133887158 n=1 Tax=Phragmites australis TaxID=29695 RepID=UPI002D7943CE|nr:uncharacterized protein LOC133887158 [Phragmites australis]
MEEPIRRREPDWPAPRGAAWREPSPACTHGPSWRESSLGAGGTRRPSCLLLDRFVHRSSRDAEDEGDGTTSVTSYTCVGRPIRSSLRVADSPAVSRLYLHLPGSPEPPGMEEPSVIAAHRHSILFKVVAPLEHPWWCNDTFRFPFDLFVYSAFSSPPSLHRLPACFIGVVSTPHEVEFIKPYGRQQQRPMLAEEMGLLCHGSNGEFTVADFTHFAPDPELCLLHYHAPAPGSGKENIETQWRVKKVRLPPMGPDVCSWRTDAVIPINGRFLCWVDYYQGILAVDILLANDESIPDQQLRYIPLPEEALRSRRTDTNGDSTDPARCVCVTVGGMIKLICITNGGTSRVRAASRSAFTITSWTLFDIFHRRWHKDGSMETAEFWGLYGGQSLPRVKPSYPLVSLVHPDVTCFLLEEDQDTFWMIEVNTRDMVLLSSALYINEEEEEEQEQGCSTNMDRRNIFDGHSFIPSEFFTYLSKDAITSRERSEMMQKAKQLRLVQKKSRAKEAKLKESLSGLKLSECNA